MSTYTPPEAHCENLCIEQCAGPCQGLDAASPAPSAADRATELLAAVEVLGARKALTGDWRQKIQAPEGRAGVLAQVRPIAEALADLILRPVIDLHRPMQTASGTFCGHCWDRTGEGAQEWPCETYRAISGALDLGEKPDV